MSLEERSRHGDLVSQVLARSQPDIWNTVNGQRNILSPHLNVLRHHGFLPLNIPFFSSLVNEISSLPFVGVGNSSDGNHIETEYLHNVSALPSVQRLYNDSQLHAIASFIHRCSCISL